MSRVMGRVFALAVLLSSTGCFLPDRDNPHDPAIAPIPALLFRDLGFPLPSGLCPAVNGSAQVVAVASRGTCLLLDASGSEDPQGEELDYRFSYSTGGDLIALHDGVLEDGLFPLAPGFLRRFTGTDGVTPARFAVETRDGGGHRRSLVVDLTIADAAPIVEAIPLRRIPIGGFPWSSGEATLDFRSPASDPDGDQALEYCWRFPDLPAASTCGISPDADGFICSSDPRHACFTRVVPATDAGSSTAVLRVRDDGGAISSEVPAAVVIGAPVVWTRPGGGIPGAHFERIDGARETFATADYALVALFDELDPPAIAIADRPTNDYQVQLARFPETVPSSAVVPLAPANLAGIAADPARLRLWSVAVPYTAPNEVTTTTLRTWLVDSSTLSLSDEMTLLIAESDTGANFRPNIQIDGNGNAWIGRTGGVGPSIHVVSPAGDRTDLASPVGSWAGLAARPESTEVWGALSPDLYDTESSFEPATILRFTDPQSDPVEYETGLDTINALVFAGADRLWVGSATDGLFLLDVARFESGGFEAAIVQHAEMIPFPDLVADPVSGAVFGANTLGSFRMSAEGEITPILNESYAEPLAVDGSGLLWFGGVYSFGLGRGESFSTTGTVASVDLPLVFSPSPDIRTGGLVLQGFGFPGVAIVSADGATARFRTSMQYVGAPNPVNFPAVFPLRLAPGTDVLWTIPRSNGLSGATGVERIDLSSDPASATRVADAALAEDLVLLEPSSPGSTLAEHAWVVRESTGDVARLARDGTLTTLFQIPPTERSFGDLSVTGARALATNALCLATLQDDGGSFPVVRLRRIEESGVVVDLATITLSIGDPSTFYTVGGVAASSDASGVACWVAVVDDKPLYATSSTAISGWTAPGTPVHMDYVESPGKVTSLLVTDNDELWVDVQDKVDTNSDNVEDTFHFRFVRARWNGASWDRSTLDTDYVLHLIGPETSARPF